MDRLIVIQLFILIYVLVFGSGYNPLLGNGYFLGGENILNLIFSGIPQDTILNGEYINRNILQALLEDIIGPILRPFSILILTLLILYHGDTRYRLPIYPAIFIPLIMGDYTTPLLAYLYVRSRHQYGRILYGGLILLADPVILLTLILVDYLNNPGEGKLYLPHIPGIIIGVLILRLYIPWLNDYGLLFLPALIILAILHTYYTRNLYPGIISILSYPFTYNSSLNLINSGKSPSGERSTDRLLLIIIILILFILLVIPTAFIYGGSVNEYRSPGLRDFLEGVIPRGSKVLIATTDPYIIKTLSSMDVKGIYYSDALYWDWGDRGAIKILMDGLVNLSFKHDAKYIVILKGPELAYWLSPRQFREYKYPFIYPGDRYLIVLENIKLYDNKYPFYIDYLDDSRYSLLNEESLVDIWSNVSIDMAISDGLITISHDGYYVVYLTFRIGEIGDLNGLERNFLLLSLSSPDAGVLNSLEIYGYRDGALESLWVRTGIDRNNVIILMDINLSDYSFITLKIDTYGEINILEFSIEPRVGESPYSYIHGVDGGYIVNNLSSRIGVRSSTDTFIVDGSPIDVGGSIPVNISKSIIQSRALLLIYILYVILILIHGSLTLIKHTNLRRGLGLVAPGEGYILDYRILYVIMFTLILYDFVYYPDIIDRNWIGDGPIIIAYILILSSINVLEFRSRNVDWWASLTLIVLMYSSILFRDILHKYIIYSLGYIDKWYLDSYTGLVNTFTALILYTLTIIILYGNIDYRGYMGIFMMLIPSIYLLSSLIQFYLDLTNSPIASILSPLHRVVGLISGLILKHIGYENRVITYNYGTLIWMMDGYEGYSVLIGWPCTGISGLIIFTFFHLIGLSHLEMRGRRIGIGRNIKLYVIGFTATYLLNIARVVTIILSGMLIGIHVSEVFHSLGYEAIFLLWIIIYLILIDRSASDS